MSIYSTMRARKPGLHLSRSIVVRVSKDTDLAIRARAEVLGVSVSDMIRAALCLVELGDYTGEYLKSFLKGGTDENPA
jgi:hypothetical protein